MRDSHGTTHIKIHCPKCGTYYYGKIRTFNQRLLTTSCPCTECGYVQLTGAYDP